MEAHLMAIWFCMRYDPWMLCVALNPESFSQSGGWWENTGTNGYHETITIFWWRWINLFYRLSFYT